MGQCTRSAIHGTRTAAKSADGRHHRGRGVRPGFFATDLPAVHVHCVAGRLRLHGAGGLHDGSFDEPDRPEWSFVFASDVIVRLRRAWCDGDAGD